MTGKADIQPGINKSEDSETLFSAVGDLSVQLGIVEKFISRRFDELSMEINATSQQVDMAEEGIVNRFSEIVEVLHAISFRGDGKTPANAGVELDAVVDMTENAANTILDAAGHINTVISADVDWTSEDARRDAFAKIGADIDAIFMACSFQDITGQRIRNTLDNLKEIEDRLNKALHKMGIAVEINENPMGDESYAKNQDDVDALFEGK